MSRESTGNEVVVGIRKTHLIGANDGNQRRIETDDEKLDDPLEHDDQQEEKGDCSPHQTSVRSMKIKT